MFYISDYITKFDEKTYHVLSLLSQAVVANANNSGSDSGPLTATKSLLHKCLSQLTRQQQIHAQQATWYIRGHGDALMSHEVVPMMSGALLATVVNEDDSEEEDNTEISSRISAAEFPVRVMVTPNGEIVHSSQIENYLYRDSGLADVSFYEFIHRFSIERRSKTSKGSFKRFELQQPHTKAHKYQIVERINYECGPIIKLRVPQVIGSSIPRKSSPLYPVFALAHFKPFSMTYPLVANGETFEETFSKFEFSTFNSSILENWEALHECEDERDAERLKKQLTAQKAAKALTKSMNVTDGSDLLEIDETAAGTDGGQDPKVQSLLRSLVDSEWLHPS
ncbi:hypothetical protein R3P38DRAFT_2563635, partial [Favolaschia claudopus]